MFPSRRVVRRIVEGALAEDVGRGDVTTAAFVDADTDSRAVYLARNEMVLCGGPLLPVVFEVEDPRVSVEVHFPDGIRVKPGTVLAEAEGSAVSLLAAERISLNFLQRLSGIATVARRYVDAVCGTGAEILDTRKTTPGLRALEKYAVRVGGARNHRSGLDDGILVKENHIVAAGGLERIMEKLGSLNRGLLQVEIEVQSLDQLRALLELPVDVVMLDNMTAVQVAEAVQIVGGKFKLEASGGITLENVREFAETGVDFISIGALTHSYQSSDISFLLQK